MQLSSFDTSKGLIVVKEIKSSANYGGCVNVILLDGSVLSAQGDTRPAGTDGPWEAGQLNGTVVTYHDNAKFYSYGLAIADKVPR